MWLILNCAFEKLSGLATASAHVGATAWQPDCAYTFGSPAQLLHGSRQHVKPARTQGNTYPQRVMSRMSECAWKLLAMSQPADERNMVGGGQLFGSGVSAWRSPGTASRSKYQSATPFELISCT
jgi:hypothetical protein